MSESNIPEVVEARSHYIVQLCLLLTTRIVLLYRNGGRRSDLT